MSDNNYESGMQWGMQGAQIGGQYGGWMGAIVGAAAGFVFGKSVPDNERIMLENYNKEVVKHHARDLMDMQREHNNENMRTAQALATYQEQRKVQTATISAMMGAAEVVGSSANAVKQVLDLQTNEAMNQTIVNAIIGFENYNTHLDQMTNKRITSLKRYKDGGGVDYGQLVSQGVATYKQMNNANGGAGFTWDNRWGNQGGSNVTRAKKVDPSSFSGGGGGGMGGGGGGGMLSMFNSGVGGGGGFGG